jgi:deferrochelatase/peroxidase EfeB
MTKIDRRQFVSRSLTTVGAAGLGVAGGLAAAPAGATKPSPAQMEAASAHAELSRSIGFDGHKQAGILTGRQDQATFVALDSVAGNPADLRSALTALSYKARQLAAGGPTSALTPDRDPTDDPPDDSGILGLNVLPDGLTVTIAFGAGLFDDRYGLSRLRPTVLTPMPRFANDRIDPALSDGDVLVQVCAGNRDTVVHAVRELLRSVRGALEPRWAIDGFQGAARGPSPRSSRRNLFAFRDGTSNPDVTDPKQMDRFVWTHPGPGVPAWAVGGTVQVVRIIRMHVEFWDRIGLREQETIIGRVRESGAPLGGTSEYEDPRFDLDPAGKRIPLDAHIRLANPRTAATDDQRILRRGYSFSRGFDGAGTQDQGLIFVAFNQDPARQFATIQKRLDNEPMVDYITPVGGGYFFAPRGTGGDRFGWIGEGLFAA